MVMLCSVHEHPFIDPKTIDIPLASLIFPLPREDMEIPSSSSSIISRLTANMMHTSDIIGPTVLPKEKTCNCTVMTVSSTFTETCGQVIGLIENFQMRGLK